MKAEESATAGSSQRQRASTVRAHVLCLTAHDCTVLSLIDLGKCLQAMVPQCVPKQTIGDGRFTARLARRQLQLL